jgi:hypothetical protein
MNERFAITIKSINGYLSFPVIIEVDWVSFKRFKIVGKNGELTLEKHSPKNGSSYWKAFGRLPKTEAGRLQVRYMEEELESYLKNRQR